MNVAVTLRPEAEADIREAHAILESARQGSGVRFDNQVAGILQRLEIMPELYGVISLDVRAARVKRFRYVIYYAFLGDRVEVLAVLHGSRDPSAWQSRA